jgi:micrococcal nuclease
MDHGPHGVLRTLVEADEAGHDIKSHNDRQPMTEFEYWYQATVLSIHDGDTMTLRIDMGRRILIEDSIRLYRINAPELSQAGGKEARDYLRHLVPIGSTVRVQTFRNVEDKYGRWLGDVYLGGVQINDKLVETGHARLYGKQ